MIFREKGNEEVINLLQVNTELHKDDVKKNKMGLNDDQSSFIMNLRIKNTKNAIELYNSQQFAKVSWSADQNQNRLLKEI